jgi:hypothetical protein
MYKININKLQGIIIGSIIGLGLSYNYIYHMNNIHKLKERITILENNLNTKNK